MPPSLISFPIPGWWGSQPKISLNLFLDRYDRKLVYGIHSRIIFLYYQIKISIIFWRIRSLIWWLEILHIELTETHQSTSILKSELIKLDVGRSIATRDYFWGQLFVYLVIFGNFFFFLIRYLQQENGDLNSKCFY